MFEEMPSSPIAFLSPILSKYLETLATLTGLDSGGGTFALIALILGTVTEAYVSMLQLF